MVLIRKALWFGVTRETPIDGEMIQFILVFVPNMLYIPLFGLKD